MPDIGDEVTVALHTLTGATVSAVVTSPAGAATTYPVTEDGVDDENLAVYPLTFVPSSAGYWKVVFSASGAAVAKERFDIRVRDIDDAEPPIATVLDYEEITEKPVSGTSAARRIQWLLRAISSGCRVYSGRSFNPPEEWLVAAVVEAVDELYTRDPTLRSYTVGDESKTFTVDATGRPAFLTSRLRSMLPRQISTINTVWSDYGPSV